MKKLVVGASVLLMSAIAMGDSPGFRYALKRGHGQGATTLSSAVYCHAADAVKAGQQAARKNIRFVGVRPETNVRKCL